MRRFFEPLMCGKKQIRIKSIQLPHDGSWLYWPHNADLNFHLPAMQNQPSLDSAD